MNAIDKVARLSGLSEIEIMKFMVENAEMTALLEDISAVMLALVDKRYGELESRIMTLELSADVAKLKKPKIAKGRRS